MDQSGQSGRENENLISAVVKHRDLWCVSLGIAILLLVSLAFVLIRGENIYIQIHDFLDSYPAWFRMLRDNGLFFKMEGTVPFLSGIDRNYMPSDLHAYSWLHMIFSPFVAVVTAGYLKILMSIAGFVFLGWVIGPPLFSGNWTPFVACGFLYGIAPTYPASDFAFASLPFLLGLLIFFYRRFQWQVLLALLCYPVFSSVAVFGFFICGYLLLFFFLDWIVRKKANLRLLLALAALLLGYIVVEWRLFYEMFFSRTPSLRTEMNVTFSFMDFLRAGYHTLQSFITGHYHSGSLHTYIVLPACFVYFLYLNISYKKRKAWKEMFMDPYNWLMLWLGVNAFAYGFDKAIQLLVGAIIPPLRGFSFARTLWLNPFLWYLSFLIILCRIKRRRLKVLLCILAFCVLCCKSQTYNHISYNLKLIVQDVTDQSGTPDHETLQSESYLLTYKEFYSEALFNRIKEDIHYNGEWSAAFGMHPSILEYSGIWTLDGYQSFYPLEYKNQFRRLITPELDMDEQHRDYFDGWGGRAYLYSDEISYQPRYEMEQDAAHLYIDPEVFREMGGKYIFSRVKVLNAEELGLRERGVYTDEQSPYTIYVYDSGLMTESGT